MLRLQRYILGELLTAFGLVLVLVTGVFLAGSLLQALQKFPELSVLALLQSVPLFLGLALPVSVPLSFLIACLLSYGRFADDNEFLAMQMGGVSPRHAVAPGVCAAAFVSIFTVALSCDVNPSLTSAKKSILHGQVKEQVERMRLSSTTSIRIRDTEMSWAGRDGPWFLDVFLTHTVESTTKDGTKTKRTHPVRARRARVDLVEGAPLRLVIHLVGASSPSDGGPGGGSFGAESFDVVIDVDEDPGGETKGRDEMLSSELYYRMARLEPMLSAQQAAEWRSYRTFAGEYWKRVALGLSPLAFALLGVPLGLVVRRGSRAQALVVALVVALPVYYPLLLWGENLSRQGHLPPALALNLGNLLLGGIGVALTARLVTR